MLTANTDSAVGPRASMFTNARELTFTDTSFQIIHGDAYINKVVTPHKPSV